MVRDEVVSLVENLEARKLLKPNRISGSWYTLSCPFHGDGNEKKPSCGILLEDQYKNGQLYPAGMCNCFACHYSGNVEKWVRELFQMKGVTEDPVAWIKSVVPSYMSYGMLESESLVPPEVLASAVSKFAADSLRLRLQATADYVSEEELASYRFIVPYMYQRKLTDEVITRYDVGFDGKHIPPGRKKPLPCITFPVRDISGNTLFFCRRSIEGKYYNYPQGVTKPVYGIYELPKDARSVIVCESIINALTLVGWGYRAVALMGTGNSYQMSQLQKLGIPEFVICLDGDEAGRKGTLKLKNELKRCSIVYTISMTEGKDVNDLTKDEFEVLYQNRE